MFYRTDPATGKTYAFDPHPLGVHTLDDRRSERDAFDKLLERRASELPRKRRSLRERERNEWLLGGVKRSVDGKVACPECGAENLADSGYCGQCALAEDEASISR